MSPPYRDSIAEIARSTGITPPTIYNWRRRWQKQGQLVQATSKPPEQWSASAKLVAVIQAGGFMLEHALEISRAGREELIGITEVDLHGDGPPMAQRRGASSAAPIRQ